MAGRLPLPAAIKRSDYGMWLKGDHSLPSVVIDWKSGSLALLPDNTTLISGSKDGEVLAWDTAAFRQGRKEHVVLPSIVSWRFDPAE